MEQTVRRLRPFGTTVFARMSDAASRHGAVNLGQGAPDENGPAGILAAAGAAIAAGHNQYPPGTGIPELRAAVAADRLRRRGVRYDPETEILVTVGATEGIAASVLGLVEPGDEVVLIEPFFDTYATSVALAGGIVRTVPMTPGDDGWRLDLDALRRTVTPRTRMLLMNTPHNPTGAVYGPEELAVIAAVCIENDVIVVADEVYEHLVYDGAEHLPIAAIPGMFERTVTLSSAAKTFNVTGWKTGWACGPADLIAGVRAAKQVFTYAGATPLQHAVAYALENEDAWIETLRATMTRRRNLLTAGLRRCGFRVIPSRSTYFVVADARPLGFTDGERLCDRLPIDAGVAAIPMAAFTAAPGAPNPYIRFAFCKSDAALEEGLRRLSRWARTIRKDAGPGGA